MKKFEVQEFTECGGWVAGWADSNGRPVVFATKEQAETGIDKFIDFSQELYWSDQAESVKNPADYRVREVEAKKTYKHESFGELLEFAESLGWVDNEDQWNEEIAEGLEAEATAFIEKAGYEVIY